MENPKPDFPIWKRGECRLCLLVLIIIAGTRRQNHMKGEVFFQRLAFALTIFLWPVVALVWFLWAAPPMTTESMLYLGGLRSNAAAVATLLLG